MLGLNGVVVKSHGGTDAQGFAHAVDVAMDMVVHRFNDRIREDLARIALDKRCRRSRRRRSQTPAGSRRSRTRDRPATASAPPPEQDHRCRSVPSSPAVGGYLPERIVTNDELARTVDTSDAWIRERTGIRQRHFAGPHETAAFMGTAAARAALADAGATPADVDAIILATSTPDQAFPATALRVQAALGVTGGFGFDLSAACAGFIYALSVADGMIRAGQARGVLVIGSEVYSRILNWQDRGTCVLFGDGAGAVFLRAGDGAAAADRGILSTHLHAQGTLGDILYVDGAVGRPDKPGHLVMNGREVFRHAVDPAGRGGGRGAGRQRPDTRRRRLAGAAPGQPAHHRCAWAASWGCRRSGWW